MRLNRFDLPLMVIGTHRIVTLHGRLACAQQDASVSAPTAEGAL